MLTLIFPFDKNTQWYDKPANAIKKPLDDELGWDRVKNIFSLECVSYYTYLDIKSFCFKIVYIKFYTMDHY